MTSDTLTSPTRRPWRHYVIGLVLGGAMFGAGGVFFSAFRPQLPAWFWSQQTPSPTTVERDVQLILSYQESFLNVVMWGLGLVTAIAGAGIGFNIFIAREAYDRDLQGLRAEVDRATREQEMRMSTSLAELRSEMQTMQTVIKDVSGLRGELVKLRDELLWTRCETWALQADSQDDTAALVTYAQILETAPRVIGGAYAFVPPALDGSGDAYTVSIQCRPTIKRGSPPPFRNCLLSSSRLQSVSG